jgi:hypothetical protein
MVDRIRTPQFRGSYCHLVKPKVGKPRDDGSAGKTSYSLEILLPKKDKTTVEFLKKLEAQFGAVCQEKFGKVLGKDHLKHYPIHDGDKPDEDGNVRPEAKGCWCIRAGNTRRIGVVDKAGSPITNDELAYSGAWYVASVSAWAWTHQESKGKGVSVNLHNVMKLRDDEQFGASGVPADEDFKDLIETDGAAASGVDDLDGL